MKIYLCKVKKCAVIIILVLFLKPIFPVIDYAVNYDYISKVLCINKDKPELKCNGKCHLMKELAKASEDDKPISSDKKQSSNPFVDLFVTETTSFNFLSFQNGTNQELNCSYANLYSYLDSSFVFHPPIFIS
ncbi:hypothetical protein [Flavobacterium frigoris]|uniref:Uncharacterized protein n=1 Tax=Flavobacterium frigoris TaxID=229204 RepID=A0A1H9FDQ9_FLAFI|nr:hypothetical protein [Flavobacterium frigoris]SEQ35458.1 hypothetical protein SAMN05444355_102145 [Flavobacterium frigoris]